MIFRPILLSLALVPITAAVSAQETSCEGQGSNGMVTVVLCPPGLDIEAWKTAGIAACEDREPCGAWIWDDVAMIPVDIPERHDQLPAESVQSAKAIWVNETTELMILEKE